MKTDHSDYAHSIHHDGSGRYVKSAHSGEPRIGSELTLRLRAAHAAPIQRVLLRTCPDGEQQFTEMQPVSGRADEACQWWQATLQMTMPVVNYRFLIFASDGAWWYNGEGLHRHTPNDAADFRLLAGYAAPAWVRNSVFYQIFPDRFADGDPGNNVRDGEYDYRGQPARARQWGQPPTQHGLEAMVEFYGGDLAGIEQRLDYLAELGINAIYLNPIFTAYSNHRYDVADYYAVDPHLGGNAALASLRRATQARGLKLILDIVPNHCGFAHPWFQAALADPNAPTAEYFTFHHHPQDYACWLGVRGLPKLNYRSPALRQVIYAGPQAVFRHWLRPPYSIDGWRIDVANMLARQGADQQGLKVARDIRQAVKEENPLAYLMGENFFDATPHLQGDCWDAVMNYAGFTMPLWHWLGRFEVHQHGQPSHVASAVPWPAQALADTWQAFRAAIPWVIARQQFNLISSHDTLRIHSGDAGRTRLAVGLLMTYVGAPNVYYGDEIGLSNKDTLARSCMPWERATWDEDMRALYQKLIALRKTSPALVDGGFQVLLAEEDMLAYLRDAEQEQLVIVGHRGPGERPAGPLPVAHGAIPDGAEFVELLSGTRATVVNGCLPLPSMPVGVAIWQHF